MMIKYQKYWPSKMNDDDDDSLTTKTTTTQITETHYQWMCDNNNIIKFSVTLIFEKRMWFVLFIHQLYLIQFNNEWQLNWIEMNRNEYNAFYFKHYIYKKKSQLMVTYLNNTWRTEYIHTQWMSMNWRRKVST